MTTSVLRLENIYKRFGGVITAEDVSFELHAGEILGLIGPNGAGKTTMMNLISGIYAQDSGSIFIDDKNISKVPAYRRARMGLARTFQSPRFLQKSNISDNLYLGTDLGEQLGYWKSYIGKQKHDFKREADELMRIAHVDIDWSTPITSIPYGTLKLMEIVRAMLEKPRIMLVDEPAAGLNSQEIEYAVDLLKEAAYNRGIGVILIEHSMDMVMNICNRIIVLNFGKIISRGTPEEVSMDPVVIEAYLGRESDA